MKKVFLFLFIVFSSTAFGTEYKEGTHYEDIQELKEQKNKIIYVYSLYCPYCALYSESLIPELTKNIPESVVIDDAYYAPKGQYGAEAIKVMAVIKYIDPAKYHTAKQAYFHELNQNGGAKLNNKGADNFINFGLDSVGISRAEYDKLADSAEVKKTVDEWSSVALPSATKVGGIPIILVNGKYSVNMESITSMDMFLDIVKTLLTK